MGRICPGLYPPHFEGVVDHPLDELAAQVEPACQIGHGRRRLACKGVEHRADTHRHAHDGLVVFDAALHRAVERSEDAIDLGKPGPELIRCQCVGHIPMMTPELSESQNYDTLGVMMRRFALPDDQHLAYADHGEGADALVFLHGGGLDHRMWAPQVAAFDDHRVIAPDARAHGESSTPTGPYRLVDDVLALLDGLGIEQAVVVGLSMGAGTAVDLAIEYPERVRGVVVSGTGTSDPDFRDPWVLEILETWQRAADERDPEAWVEGFARFLPGPHRRPEQVDAVLRGTNDDMVRHTLVTHVLPLVAQGRTPIQPTKVEHVNERRAHIAAPTLAIIGGSDADDHIRLARELLAQIPHGREVVVPDTAHYPNLEEPDQFNAALRTFLKDIGIGPRARRK